GRPETVFQLRHPDLAPDFPPLRSLDNPELKHNLPQQVTSFIGREKEIAEVRRLFGTTRLLTLTGAGGCGKTRLALQAAADLLDGSGDAGTHGSGCWLVELAALADPGLVPRTAASALGLREEPGRPILQTLTDHLKGKHLLLFLDNCEHLLDACARLADTLLRSCPRVLLLATSREPLGIAGETAFRVPSLSVPDPEGLRGATPERLSPYESVRLFIERARQVQPGFQVTNRSAPALASVCHRLDGIPLALELAAARVRSLTVEELNQRLDQRFRLLTGGSRTALPRLQTLRALIDWSYDLLSAAEQALLCRLSVFAGGWTLDAAEQVCTGEGVEAWEVLDLLTGLADKSMVVAAEQEGATRYRLLETVRQYGQDRLRERDEEAAWRDRHLAHYLALAEEAAPELTGREQAAWLVRLETEHDNLRAALEWSGETGGGAESGVRLAGALWRFWEMHGHFTEGREWLARVLDAGAGTAPVVRAEALNGAGNLANDQGDYAAARAFHQESLAIRRGLGDRRGIAGSLNNLGNVACDQSDYGAARALLEESLAIKRELGDQRGIAGSLGNLGRTVVEQGDYAAARALQEESLAIGR
ncbi:MAG: tetratricopeptide repeat protein, partial [Armatimonadetes bacterium]|nr:tetratricopeptide repeat protein [Armatimonadota bacterium]